MIKTYAKMSGNIVENVILATEEDLSTLEGIFIECSQDGSIRFNYPQIGATYDLENDAFINKPLYQSWILNSQFKWDPPVPKPESGQWFWDENSTSWIEIE